MANEPFVLNSNLLDFYSLTKLNASIPGSKDAEAFSAAKQSIFNWGFLYLKSYSGFGIQLFDNIVKIHKAFYSLQENHKRAISLKNRKDYRGYIGLMEEMTQGVKDIKESLAMVYPNAKEADDLHPAFTGNNPHIPFNEDMMDLLVKLCFTGDIYFSEKFMDEQLNSYMAHIHSLAVFLYMLFCGLFGLEHLGSLHQRTCLLNYMDVDGIEGKTQLIPTHTDLAMFNILRVTQGGLKIRSRANQIHTVKPDHHTYAVIFGDMARHLSGGQAWSCIHQVMYTESQDNRISIPSFFFPNLRKVLNSPGGYVSEEMQGKTSGDILLARLRKIHPTVGA